MDILGLIFPKKCINCGKGEKYVCAACLLKVRSVKPICPMCDKPSIDGMVHFKCKKKLGMDGLVSLWEYEGVIRKSILYLKYKFAFDMSQEIVGYTKLKLKNVTFPKENFTLIPIPIHILRENWRGFNQSEILGREIAKLLGFKFIPDLLIKKKITFSQTEVKAEERSRNVAGIFVINPKYLKSNIQKLILFDDVWTTGSTMKEATKVLKRSGVQIVWGLTVAR